MDSFFLWGAGISLFSILAHLFVFKKVSCTPFCSFLGLGLYFHFPDHWFGIASFAVAVLTASTLTEHTLILNTKDKKDKLQLRPGGAERLREFNAQRERDRERMEATMDISKDLKKEFNSGNQN